MQFSWSKLLVVVLVSYLIVLPTEAEVRAGYCSGAQYEERNGLVVMEIESTPPAAGWANKASLNGFTGTSYYEWTGPKSNHDPGNGLLQYSIYINTPGTYRFQWHSYIAVGNNTTESNDSWLRFPNADDFYGRKNNSIVYPGGTGKSPTPNGSSKEGWFKVYRNTPLGEWTWTSNTSDNDAHRIFVEFDSAGVYTLQVSGRSIGHAIDRMVLYDTSRVDENTATNLSQPMTHCILSNDSSGKDTIGIYNSASGSWYLRDAHSVGAPTHYVFSYGPGNIPVTGDWNGDGVDTIGIYNFPTGAWYLRNANDAGAPNAGVFNFGRQNIPVTGDWDGNGTDTIGVYNPTTGNWYLRDSNSSGSPDYPSFTYGRQNIPVTGDWNNDGKDTIGVYNEITGRWYLRNSNDKGAPDISVFAFGRQNIPVTGDWNGNGTDTIGVYNLITGNWYLRNTNNRGSSSYPAFTYGPGNIPIVGDFNGSGLAPSSLPSGIAAFSLVNANTGALIQFITDGATLSNLPDNVQVVAEAFGGDTVTFDYQGVEAFATDAEAPYTLTGDAPTELAPGEHTLTATLHAAEATVDTLTITFTVE